MLTYQYCETHGIKIDMKSSLLLKKDIPFIIIIIITADCVL